MRYDKEKYKILMCDMSVSIVYEIWQGKIQSSHVWHVSKYCIWDMTKKNTKFSCQQTQISGELI